MIAATDAERELNYLRRLQRPNAERERIRAELNRRRAVRAAEALTDTHALERKTEREALAAMLNDKRLLRADAATRRAMRDLHAARRRDQLARALDYPMSDAELIAACQHATLAAKVPEEHFSDVSQGLALHVIRRYGPRPPRVKLHAGWLKQRALAIYIDQDRQTERTTGRRAAAEQLDDWRAADHRAAMADAAASGDLVWALAANRPARDLTSDHATAHQVADKLSGVLTHLQRDAVRVALTSERNRPLTNLERQHYHAATAILRKRFHTADAVRAAIRPNDYAARALTDAAISIERKRAAIAARGSHLTARPLPAASAMPLRRFRRPAPGKPEPARTVGPITWPRESEYGGSCSVLYLYRGGSHRNQT